MRSWLDQPKHPQHLIRVAVDDLDGNLACVVAAVGVSGLVLNAYRNNSRSMAS